MHVTVPLVLEYEATLLRHRGVPGWTRRETLAFLGLLVERARRQEVHYLWRGHTGDPNDAHVLEAAVAADVEYLVTFNITDLSSAKRFGVEVLTPGAFLRTLE